MTCRLVDVLACAGWFTAVLLAVLGARLPGPPGEMAVWALLISAASAAATVIAWWSRHLTDYQNGLDAGLRAAQIVRLPDRDRDRV